jgi:hypothetical protein
MGLKRLPPALLKPPLLYPTQYTQYMVLARLPNVRRTETVFLC